MFNSTQVNSIHSVNASSSHLIPSDAPSHARIGHHISSNPTTSRRNLHHLEALPNHLRNVLILMLQQAQGERDIVPLALRLAPLEACGQLLGQLFGVLVLFFP